MGLQFTRDEHINFELAAEGIGYGSDLVNAVPVYMIDIYLGPDVTPEAIKLAKQQAEGDARRLPLLDVGARHPEPVVDGLSDEFWKRHEITAAALLVVALPWAEGYPKVGSIGEVTTLKVTTLTQGQMDDSFSRAEMQYGLNGGNGFRYSAADLEVEKNSAYYQRSKQLKGTITENMDEWGVTEQELKFDEEMQEVPAAEDHRPSRPKAAVEVQKPSWPYNTFPADEEAVGRWLTAQADKARVRARRAHARQERKRPPSQAEWEKAVMGAAARIPTQLLKAKNPDEKHLPLTFLRTRKDSKGFGTVTNPMDKWEAAETLAGYNSVQNHLRRTG